VFGETGDPRCAVSIWAADSTRIDAEAAQTGK
jgi:hypothetical protein